MRLANALVILNFDCLFQHSGKFSGHKVKILLIYFELKRYMNKVIFKALSNISDGVPSTIFAKKFILDI